MISKRKSLIMLSVFTLILALALSWYRFSNIPDPFVPPGGILVDHKGEIETIEELGYGRAVYKREQFVSNVNWNKDPVIAWYRESLSEINYKYICSPSVSISRGNISDDCDTLADSFPFDHKSDLLFRKQGSDLKGSIITVKITSNTDTTIVNLELTTLISSETED